MKKTLILAWILLSACAHHAGPNQASKDAAGVKAAASQESVKRPFVSPTNFYFDVDSYPVDKFPPMPALDSRTDRQDMKEVFVWQKKRTNEDCARAASEVEPTFENFFASMGTIKKPVSERADEILWKIRSDVSKTVSRIKKSFKRLRPYMRDAQVEPCVKKETGFSYPSGHATISEVYGLMLMDLDPAHKGAYRKRAEQGAWDRVIAGVHHPSDVHAGLQLAKQLYKEFKKSAAFRADLKELKGLLLP